MKKFQKAWALLIAAFMTVSLIQLPAFADDEEVPETPDTTIVASDVDAADDEIPADIPEVAEEPAAAPEVAAEPKAEDNAEPEPAPEIFEQVFEVDDVVSTKPEKEITLMSALPNAVSTPVTGEDLTVTLNGNGDLTGTEQTMNTAIKLTTNDTDAGEFAYWKVDFKITTNNDIKAGDAILIGSYGNYGNIGFETNALPAGTYYVMEGLLGNAINYQEVVNDIKEFTCGIVNKSLPAGTVVSVQLVVRDTYGSEYDIGDAVNYTAPGLPSAIVEEVTGDDLIVTLTGTGNTMTGTYTMNKGVKFSTNYTDDAVKALDLATFGDWICDFQITTKSPDGNGLSGDDVALVGNYGDFGNIGFKASALGATTVADDTYDLLKTIDLDAKLTYREVVELVRDFTCGVIDMNGALPIGTKISVQLVMYEDRDRTIVHPIGLPVVYEKKAEELSLDIAKDAFIGNDGLGYIRFTSTMHGNTRNGMPAAIVKFGTWIIRDDYFLGAFVSDTENNTLKLEDSAEGVIFDRSKFNADLLEIPNTQFDTAFYGISFVATENGPVWSDIADVVINRDKNETSK